jgi:RNA-binding protein
MQKALTGKARTKLRALAHGLDPVVQVGRQGITESVLKEIGHALQAHELIKVKVSPDCPVPIADTQQPIEAGTQSEVVQIIGHVLVVYRRRAESPKVEPFRKNDPKKKIVRKRNSLKARKARSPNRRRSRR